MMDINQLKSIMARMTNAHVFDILNLLKNEYK